jgi:hypothetical protein
VFSAAIILDHAISICRLFPGHYPYQTGPLTAIVCTLTLLAEPHILRCSSLPAVEPNLL